MTFLPFLKASGVATVTPNAYESNSTPHITEINSLIYIYLAQVHAMVWVALSTAEMQGEK